VNPDDATPYVAGTLVDHHCHGLVLRDLDRAEFDATISQCSTVTAFGVPVDPDV